MQSDDVDTTDWIALTQRAGVAAHNLVGWLMWDQRAIDAYAALGVTEGRGWIVAWRLASLGNASADVAAATTYSIHPTVISMVMDFYRDIATPEQILSVRDAVIEPSLRDIAPDVADGIGRFGADLWRGVDAAHHGARPMFVAHREQPRPDDINSCLSAWLAANCLRELRGDNHWALCAGEDLDDVEVGLLHSALVDPEEYGSQEWIARSRGSDDAAITAGWRRLEAKGLAADGALNDAGVAFRHDLEVRTDRATASAWQTVGRQATLDFCELIEANQDRFLQRINETAGPRWMPAIRVTEATANAN